MNVEDSQTARWMQVYGSELVSSKLTLNIDIYYSADRKRSVLCSVNDNKQDVERSVHFLNN